jgi:hypothetical protein
MKNHLDLSILRAARDRGAMMKYSSRILYLDQNAWIALAQGASDSLRHPDQYAALKRIIDAVKANLIVVPLSFSNIYETSKINNLARRIHLSRVQSTISNGVVIRGRRRILQETLIHHFASKFGIKIQKLSDNWFLSDLWFESVSDFDPGIFPFEFPTKAIDAISKNPAAALHSYLSGIDDDVRTGAVRDYSAKSSNLIDMLEARRKLADGEPLHMRRRIYSARLLIEEIEFIISTAKKIDLHWSSITEMGEANLKSIVSDIPVLNTECEIAIRLELQNRQIYENDLRDVASFSTALPLSDIFVAEKHCTNLARQARLDKKYGVILLTSVTELTYDMLSAT